MDFKRSVGRGGWFRVEEVYERMRATAEFWNKHLKKAISAAAFFEALQEWTWLGVVEVATATKTLTCEYDEDDDEEEKEVEWIRLVDDNINGG